MKKFISKLFRFSLIGLSYLTIMAFLYIKFDPFKVLYDYNSFFDNNAKVTVATNKDYASTTTFIKNSKKINYNSFIFGNSRSIFYQISEWKKHIGADAICYHFDASGESLWALNKKVEFIDKKENNIKNILLVLDYSTLTKVKPKSGHAGIISPALVNNSNIIEFHKTFFTAFLNPKFSYAFLDYNISNKMKPYMNKVLDDRQKNYDSKTNELRFDYFENLISKGKYYTPERLSVFYDRDKTIQKFSKECIKESQKNILENIYSITQKHNSQIKIIINPLYNQIKINKADLKYLRALFGEENVFDFSGMNSFTKDYKNYYESSHYRPHIAKEIMEIIYE
jgi:ribosomal protein L20A (L18A)